MPSPGTIPWFLVGAPRSTLVQWLEGPFNKTASDAVSVGDSLEETLKAGLFKQGLRGLHSQHREQRAFTKHTSDNVP